MAQIQFSLTLGLVTRRTIIRGLREIAASTGVKFSYDEDKSWLDSHYICKVVGTNEAVLSFDKQYQMWFDAVKAEED